MPSANSGSPAPRSARLRFARTATLTSSHSSNWVNDLACVVDAAGFDRFPLLATRRPVAVEYAARYPNGVSHLVLYGTYARGRPQGGEPEVTRKARLMLELTRLGCSGAGTTMLCMQVWSSTFQPGGTRYSSAPVAEQMRLATTAEKAVRLLEIGWSADVREAARKLKCPVLVIHAERDCAVPIAEGRLLASLIPDSRQLQFDSQNQHAAAR